MTRTTNISLRMGESESTPPSLGGRARGRAGDQLGTTQMPLHEPKCTPGYGQKFAVSSEFLSPLDRSGQASAARRAAMGRGKLFPNNYDYDYEGKLQAAPPPTRPGSGSTASTYDSGVIGEISPITVPDGTRPRQRPSGASQEYAPP